MKTKKQVRAEACVRNCKGVNPLVIPDMLSFVRRVVRSAETSDAMKASAKRLLAKADGK